MSKNYRVECSQDRPQDWFAYSSQSSFDWFPGGPWKWRSGVVYCVEPSRPLPPPYGGRYARRDRNSL